jgi:hypothetical protein
MAVFAEEVIGLERGAAPAWDEWDAPFYMAGACAFFNAFNAGKKVSAL